MTGLSFNIMVQPNRCSKQDYVANKNMKTLLLVYCMESGLFYQTVDIFLI